MKMTRKERVRGCLIGAAYGDAMGAPTENRTREQIFEKWGYVDRLYAPPPDVFARGNQAGQVTDDFSMAYVAITEILKNGGIVDSEVAKRSLIEWSKDQRFFEQFVGPTSRTFINQLKGDESGDTKARFKTVNDNRRASNGGAMKIGPVALLAKGDMDTAMKIAVIICMPTHGNWISLSAACAVAAAVNSAIIGDDLCQVLQKGLEGARYGEQIGRESGPAIAGPSVKKRMKLAITMGMAAENLSCAMECMRKYFDCSGMAADSVPVSFGLIAASGGDVCKAVKAAANIGNDTDTIATIVGAVLGTYCGSKAFDQETVRMIDLANDYELDLLAEQIEQCEITIREEIQV